MEVHINSQNLTDIANSIRAQNGTETRYKPSEMSAAIDAIEDSLVYNKAGYNNEQRIYEIY